jgi:hypothetical protein
MTKLVGLIQTALPYGATNLTAADMVSLGGLVIGGKAMSNLNESAAVLEQFRIPLDGTWKYKDVHGATTYTAFRHRRAQTGEHRRHAAVYLRAEYLGERRDMAG